MRTTHRPQPRRGATGILAVALVALAAVLALPVAAPAQTPPDVLVLLVDDLGIEHVGVYGIGADPIPMPNVDALAADGLIFQNAWSNPVCSPTRVTLHTGRWAVHHGVGQGVSDDTWPGMQLEEVTLAELLRDHAPTPYATGAFGKWHMGMDESLGGTSAPQLAGYDHFEGTRGNVIDPETYYEYTKITNGVETVETQYLTSATVDDVIAWVGEHQSGPWLAYAAFHAPHGPAHWPPEELHTQDTGDTTVQTQYRAMAEAADHEIGRLLDSIDTANTLIVWASDNGSVGFVAQPPVNGKRAKHTVFEGGVRVPFVVSGDLVVPGQVDHPTSFADLYPTIAELAGATVPPEAELDGTGFAAYLSDPSAPPHRDFNYTERFEPNGKDADRDFWQQAARDARYKLLRNEEGKEGFFDLVTDPWETANLLPGLTPEEQQSYDALSLFLDELSADDGGGGGGGCDLGQPGDPCSDGADCCSGKCKGPPLAKTCR